MLEIIDKLLTIHILYNYGIKDRQLNKINRKANISIIDYKIRRLLQSG